MARVTTIEVQATKTGLLEAAKQVLSTHGYAGLTTRKVAVAAAAPMSQIQYHFGSKEGLVLALFEYMNHQLLERQTAMFNDPSLSLSQQWDLACDYLDDDLASGYVRVLQELMAAGWSNPVIGETVQKSMEGWHTLLTEVVNRTSKQIGGLGIFTPEEIVAMIISSFIGAESNILSGRESSKIPVRKALRKITDLIRLLELQTQKEEQ